MQRHLIFIGAILAGLAVVTGAFGAHGLEGFLKERFASDHNLFLRRMDNWSTAALYQMHHAIGMIFVGIVCMFRKSKWLTVAGISFLIGILLFSGSLYALVLSEVRVLGAITPLGGVSFIVGWVALAAGGCCMSNNLTELK